MTTNPMRAALREAAESFASPLSNPDEATAGPMLAEPLRSSPTPVMAVPAQGGLAGHSPAALAPERGHPRPAVLVRHRLPVPLADEVVAALEDARMQFRAEGLDTPLALLVRACVSLGLADLRDRATAGAVGEAVRGALDPARRGSPTPLPDPGRWLARPVQHGSAKAEGE
jgi:hypothetical protein